MDVFLDVHLEFCHLRTVNISVTQTFLVRGTLIAILKIWWLS